MKHYWYDADIQAPGAPYWSSPPTRSAGAGRKGTNALQFSGGAHLYLLTSTIASGVIGLAYKPTYLQDNKAFISFRDGNDTFFGTSKMQIALAMDSLGRVKVYRGDDGAGTGINTLIGQSATGLLIANSWVYIEFKAGIANSGGFASVRVNGVTAYSGINLDTQVSANANFNIIQISGPDGSNTALVDDMYINDLTGSQNNDYEGDVKIYARFPDGAADYSESTASPAVAQYLNVDDGATPDDDTTKNTLSATGQRDLFTLQAAGISSGTIVGVVPFIRAKKTDAGAAVVETMLRSGAVEVTDAIQALSTSYVTYQAAVRSLNPETNAPFTVSEFDALKQGYRRST